MHPSEESDDEVLAALDALTDALQQNIATSERMLERAATIRQRRAGGTPYSDIVTQEARPLIVELVAQNLDRLFRAGSRMRRAEARALYREGLTMERIAALFGVTRQRISALLRGDHAATGDEAGGRAAARSRPRGRG